MEKRLDYITDLMAPVQPPMQGPFSVAKLPIDSQLLRHGR